MSAWCARSGSRRCSGERRDVHPQPAKHQSEDILTLLLGGDDSAWEQWLQYCNEKYGTVEEEWTRVMGTTPVCTQEDILKAKAKRRTAKIETTPARSTSSENLLDIIHRFEGVRSSGHAKWMAFCQAHGDGKTQKRRSLSLKIVDGKILVHCFAGCPTLDAVTAAGLTMSDLFEPEATTSSPGVEGEPAVEAEAVEVDKDSFTDVALARQLASSSKQFIRYCEAKSCWYVYDGARWAQGSGNLVKPFVHQLARVFHQRAGAESDSDKRKRYRDQANRLETDRVIRAVINQAMALRSLQIDPTKFDRHRHLLNVLNGTINLKTGVLQPHNPEDLLARIAPVEYHPEATSELWERTIELAMRGDDEMVSFLQRVFGYALTGYTNEKKFFDAYGPKDTGKTTICRAFEKMLGPDYAHALRAEALMHQRDPEKIPHELADLMGVRFVVVSEVPDGRRFNEELMKALSGGDVIRACFKYANTFEFDPQLTLVLYSNDRIELGGSDDALWERATSIPFTFNFKTETTPDTNVGTTLELPEHQQGILAWAVRGAVAWAEQGLAPIPEKVREDTEAHRAEVNAVAAFLRERCQEGTGFKVAVQSLHRAYAKWAKEEHQEKLSAAKFSEEMQRLGHVITRVLINRNAVDAYLALQIVSADGV